VALPAPGAAELTIEFTEPPTFTARSEKDRTRLIIDVPGSSVRGAPPALVEGQGIISGVMIQAFSAPGRKGAKDPGAMTTRIIVTLSETPEHSIFVRGDQLVVRAAPKGALAAAMTPPALKAASSGPVVANASLRVQDVRFTRHGQEERIEVELDGQVVSKIRRTSDGTSRLELTATKLPELLQRALDVRAFGGEVGLVSSFQDGQRAILEVEHAARMQSRLTRQGTTLVWSFFPGEIPSSITGLAADGRAARKTKTIFVEDDAAAGSPEILTSAGQLVTAPTPEGQTTVSESSPEQAAGFLPPLAAQARGRYDGRRIDIDLKDADVHNVLRLLADTGRVNIITADNVSGSVTIRMRNVPWDQALDVVLQAKNLGMERRGNIIRVAPLADLEKEREMAIARAKQELQLAPLETRLIPVSYAQAADIQARAKDLLSGRGSIAVDERTNVMIIRDVAGNLDQIEELTRSLDTQTPQVLIEARIVEATSRYLRDVGVQWGGDASFSASTGNPTGLAFPNSIGLAGGASDQDTPTAGLSPFQNQVQNPNFAVNLPAAVGTGSGGALGLTFGSVDSNFNLALRLSAAETSGMLRILSSPRVLTLDNKQARISQGTLIPFSQVSAQGVQTTFQEAKLQLLVEPHVTADGSVSMHVKINRDEPDFNQTSPRGDPTILKREAETELLVMDGHTAVIGGIFTRNTGRNVDQVPFFGDIPLLGLLFQKRSASDSRGELVIFLTPRIVNRAEALGR
jgi:type IV pilus assembly protein PilQ